MHIAIPLLPHIDDVDVEIHPHVALWRVPGGLQLGEGALVVAAEFAAGLLAGLQGGWDGVAADGEEVRGGVAVWEADVDDAWGDCEFPDAGSDFEGEVEEFGEGGGGVFGGAGFAAHLWGAVRWVEGWVGGG